MDLKNLRIGYVPYEPDLSQPGDRRRFPYFAKRYGIEFDIADTGDDYDIILLTAPSNLSKWLEYKQSHPNTIFLFEMVDSLLFLPDLFTRFFKGMGRYILKKEDRLHLNYTALLRKWIAISDVIICSNTVLRNEVAKLNAKTIVSPDYLETEYSAYKTNFEISGKMKIVWEGLPSVLPHFLAYTEVFKGISSFCELHVISKPAYPVIPKVFYSSTEKFLKKLPIETVYHDWELNTHTDFLIRGDCAVIPLNPKNSFGWNKPANKLISFWFLGIPTIVSGTPAYREIMDKAGARMYCNTARDWISKINWYYQLTPEERKAMAEENYSFVKQQFSDSQLDKIWESIFELALRK